MTFLKQLTSKRKHFLDGLDANDGDINLDIFEDFYPDKAHFIYELLQNAEDTGATEATFIVTQEHCIFEHNGKRRFTERDVRAITGIHNSTKSKSPDQIGKFGFGFKSVFVYTQTPLVYSDPFAFRISRLILPEPIDGDPSLGNKTRFVLPFNNPKKPAQEAYEEITEGLEALSETTLLFLSSLETICWQIGQHSTGRVLRVKHSRHHIEVAKQINSEITSSAHFLCFSESIPGLKKHRVAIAYQLDFLPKITRFEAGKSLARQMKIGAAMPGRVAVFFPAEHEFSGLRFHLHAPFVPELSRASIKETSANQPLFEQLARLAASSLHEIRKSRLLTGEFLSVLPNSQDNLPRRYQSIRAAMIAEMNEKALTPTHTKTYAPARYLLQAGAALKALLSEDDLKFLVKFDGEPRQWAMGATKNSRQDCFLTDLAITKWDIDSFVVLLEENASESSRFLKSVMRYVDGPDASFMNWIAAKPEKWQQEMYALLSNEYLSNSDLKQRQMIERLKPLKIVRLSDNTYSVGSKCYFPGDGIEQDDLLPRAAKGIYTSTKIRAPQEAARRFLISIGVSEVGELEQIKAILTQRYTANAFQPDINDLKRFIALIETRPQQANLFGDYYIFKRSDGKWGKPSQLYLDTPYANTGLSYYYNALGENAQRLALSKSYEDSSISLEAIAKFARAVRVQTQLVVEKTSCQNNPQWEYLRHAPGQTFTGTGDDIDYTIPNLQIVLQTPTIDIARLIWQTMNAQNQHVNYLQAKYRKNQMHSPRYADSQFVHVLREAEWIPQRNGTFARPSKASHEHMPDGFPFDKGQAWLKAIHFGEEEQQRSEEQLKRQTAAKTLGFADDGALADATWFAQLTPDERQHFKEDFEKRRRTELPKNSPRNAEQRSQRISQQTVEAPERITEMRERSISVDLEDVKQEAYQYLRQQYTNYDGEMICQVCQMELPFKLDDGRYYVEKVEFLPELQKRYYQNYLAVCPNHAAMFKYANRSKDVLQSQVLNIETDKLEIILAQQVKTIHFTRTHIVDLHAIIRADRAASTNDSEP